jgi:lipid II:glycine glycyltransferase (peptidoglycan interpeptide bridge formation enzyme)
MKHEIRLITSSEIWEKIILPWQPNTFLQSWEWGETQTKDKETVQRLAVYQDNQPIAAANVILVNARRGRHYLIPHGPLFSHPQYFQSGLESIIDYLKNTAFQDKAIALRVAPLQISSPQTKSVYAKFGFRPAPLHVHTELTWILDITPNPDTIQANMRKTTRHAIHKAAKAGITCEVLTDPAALNRFWPLYVSTRQRHGFVPFSQKFLRAQWDAFSQTNRVFAVIASHQNHDVAAGIFIHYANTVFYHHGASIKLPSNLPAAQMLQWCAINEAKKRNATRYNFWGIAPDNQPNHPFAGITIFKKGFGGQAINYLHAQDLPLSLGYWRLWLIDTYRKHKRGFA